MSWEPAGYRVEQLLGAGATGEVWRAVEVATGEPVALKRLGPQAPPQAADRLRREAALLAALNSPHVVRLRAVESTAAGPVLVLDLAAGGSLADVLAQRRLAAGELVTVAAPLARTLAGVHELGLVHGDVAPANVLFTGDGRPLLSDLGVARLVAEALPEVAATPGYAAPEVARGAAPGPAADVFGLAAVCHHALHGQPPWPGTTAEETLRAAAAGRRRPAGADPAGVPPALAEAVERGLALDPGDRPTPMELAAALHAAAAPAPVRLAGPAAAPVATTHAVRPVVEAPAAEPVPARRRRRGLLAAPLALAVLAAVAGGALWGRAHRPRAQALPTPARSQATAVPAGPTTSAVTAAPAASTSRGASAAASAATTPSTPSAAATPSASAAGWAAVVQQLDDRRAAAFRTGRADLLAAVYAPGAAALRADRATVRRLTALHAHARSLHFTVRSVTVLEAAPARMRLRVVDALSAYDVVANDGRVLRHDSGRSAAPLELSLVRRAGQWRIAALRPA